MEKSEKSSSQLALAAPLLDVLSCGPAVYFSERAGVGSAVFEPVYAPLFWLHEHTIAEKPLDAYANFWLRPSR